MNRKSVFDAVRRLLGRGFRQSEVDALDRALDEATGVATESRDGVQHKASQLGIDLIKRFEGCARVRRDGLVEAYPDLGTGGAPWTIGWGATGAGIGPGTVWMQAQCNARLERDIARHAEDVAQALGNAPTTQAQFDALVSFHYNTGAIARATLTKRHLAGDYDAAEAEFARWNRAGGRIMRGLIRRREEEARLYRSGDRMNAI